MEANYIDISYNGKIKAKFTVDDMYAKIQNYIKKNKINKTWTCQKEENCISINFNDAVSDEFILDVNTNKFSGECRVNYDETIEESTLEKLLDMLFSIKGIFSKIEIDDDYSICESYLKNKEIKIQLLDLNEQDLEKVKKIYEEGYKEYRVFLLMCIARDLNLKTYKDLYINSKVSHFGACEKIERIYEDMTLQIFETWLYETTTYKKERFYNNEFYNINNNIAYQALGSTGFDTYACCHGIQSIISKNYVKERSFGVRDAQVQKFYREKIIDMLKNQENEYEQCIIAYKYLLSIMKYTGFEFVEKDKNTNGDKHYTNFKYSDKILSINDALKSTLQIE